MFDHSQTPPAGMTRLQAFEAGLRALPDLRATLKSGLIGADIEIPGPEGPRKLVYADYVASGRALRQVEDFVLDHVLPYYANTHTEASFCGAYMTRMREAARRIILDHAGGTPETHAVVFAGSGATHALNMLVHLFGIPAALARGEQVHVLVGPYEHHSNLLPWRESGATVIEIAEADTGGPDPDHLQAVLDTVTGQGPVIAAFSAASNVTGIGADVIGITRIVKRAGGRIVWDYAGGAPYLPVDMCPDGAEIDAIALSAHKFVGGPGASGVLILRRGAVEAARPHRPGGGTVAFVNGQTQDYLSRLEEREEGGTPNIVGDIRAGLVMIVKAALGQDFITRRNADLVRRALAAWADHPALTLLGGPRDDRLPIFSFIVRARDGAPFDYQRFTAQLSERYGIQARGGCACAGPYVHKLLGITPAASDRLRAEILAGDESHKPGFVRLNFSVLMSDAEVDFVLHSVAELAEAFAAGTEPNPIQPQVASVSG
jgi:selenocysteine lyase/cysteine desulfurase